MDPADAQRAIATLHGFRFFGLVFLLPGVVGPELPAGFAHFAAYGDFATGLLALLALLTFRVRPLYWLFVAAFNVVGVARRAIPSVRWLLRRSTRTSPLDPERPDHPYPVTPSARRLQVPYSSAKAAVHHLTKSLAGEWTERGVDANCVAPTYVEPPMSNASLADRDRTPAWMEFTPMKRVARPDEIAPTILFLASDASSAMTGATFLVDCGHTVR